MTTLVCFFLRATIIISLLVINYSMQRQPPECQDSQTRLLSLPQQCNKLEQRKPCAFHHQVVLVINFKVPARAGGEKGRGWRLLAPLLLQVLVTLRMQARAANVARAREVEDWVGCVGAEGGAHSAASVPSAVCSLGATC